MALTDILKTKLGRAIETSFVLGSIILPPLWLIFDFERDLFIKMDLIKLLLVCAALGSATLIFNYSIITVCSIIIYDADYSWFKYLYRERPDRMYRMFVGTCIMNFLVFFAPSIGVFQDDALTLNKLLLQVKNNLGWIIILPILGTIVLKLIMHFVERRQNNKVNPPAED